MNKYVDKYVNRDKRLSRGIRNNNPGNIRRTSTNWFGLSHLQKDPEFCQFETMEYGIRALVVLLRTYYNKYHCYTIKKIITRYAPSNENNTEAYIKFVCDFLSIPPDFEMSLSTCFRVALPIMVFESGYRLHTDSLNVIIEKYHIL